MNSKQNDDIEEYKSQKWLFSLLGVFVLILALPALLSQFSILDFTETGQIGDTIGGITAPFIGFISAYLVYKAFEEQRKANNHQLKLIKAQQHDREFTIYFKLIEDLKSSSETMMVNDKYSIADFCKTITPRFISSSPDFSDWMIKFDPFIDQFCFILDFIDRSNCKDVDKRFFRKKLKLDFDTIIKSLCNFFYQKERLMKEEDYVLIESVFDKLGIVVNFNKTVIKDEQGSY